MSNKPKRELRLVPYIKTKGERYYTALCQIVEGKRGTTKKLKTLLGWAKADDPSYRSRKYDTKSPFQKLVSRLAQYLPWAE